MGSFTFVNFTGSCTTGLHPTDNHGFYAAVFRASDGWGFFEVEGVNTMGGPGGTVQSLAQFEKAVLARNPGTSFSSAASNTYTTLHGDPITCAIPYRDNHANRLARRVGPAFALAPSCRRARRPPT